MFDLKQLLIFISALGFALAIAVNSEPVAAFLILMALSAPKVFLLPPHQRRPFFYGGIVGIIFGLILSHAFLHMVFIELPRERIAYGPNAGGMRSPQIERDTSEKLRSFVITVGFVIGAAVGLISSRQRTVKTSRCSECGRENAEATIVCPRCETRLS